MKSYETLKDHQSRGDGREASPGSLFDPWSMGRNPNRRFDSDLERVAINSRSRSFQFGWTNISGMGSSIKKLALSSKKILFDQKTSFDRSSNNFFFQIKSAFRAKDESLQGLSVDRS